MCGEDKKSPLSFELEKATFSQTEPIGGERYKTILTLEGRIKNVSPDEQLAEGFCLAIPNNESGLLAENNYPATKRKTLSAGETASVEILFELKTKKITKEQAETLNGDAKKLLSEENVELWRHVAPTHKDMKAGHFGSGYLYSFRP